MPVLLCLFAAALVAVASAENNLDCNSIESVIHNRQSETRSGDELIQDTPTVANFRLWSEQRGIEATDIAVACHRIAFDAELDNGGRHAPDYIELNGENDGNCPPGFVRGVVARHDINLERRADESGEANVVVLSVPAQSILTANAARKELNHWVVSSPDIDDDWVDGLKESAALALYVAFARNESKSAWHQFVATFPDNFDSPIFSWSEEDMRELQASRVIKLARIRRRRAQQEWREIAPLCQSIYEGEEEGSTNSGLLVDNGGFSPPSHFWCSQRAFEWALMGVTSRSFRVRLPLPNPKDRIQKTGSFLHRAPSAPSAYGLVPWADLFNLRLGSKHLGRIVRHRMSDSGDLDLLLETSTGMVRRGEAIFAPYGREPFPNSRLLLDYGFCSIDNPNTEMLLRRPRIGEFDNERDRKERLINVAGLDDSPHISLSIQADVSELILMMRIIEADAAEIDAIYERVRLEVGVTDFAGQRRLVSSILAIPLSPRNEQVSFDRARAYIDRALRSYGTSIQNDDEILRRKELLTARARAALELRLLEKRVLQACYETLSNSTKMTRRREN